MVDDSPAPLSVTTLTVAPEEAGSRLDSFIAARLTELSRSRVQALIRGGHVVMAGGVITEASQRVKGGERFAVALPPAEPATPVPEARELDILFEDEHLIVLVKPAGTVVHPAPGHHAGTLVNALLAHCGDSLSGIGGVRRPGIVHRLDREVSGVLVVAKHDRAHLGLAAQFTVHSVGRVYEALVWGVPQPPQGRIERPLGRDPRNRLRMAVIRGGKRAVTDYRTLAAAGTLAARAELRLHTGRTHQIRVHLSAMGNPIIGDRLYARQRSGPTSPAVRAGLAGLDRILLHARELSFEHPVTRERLSFAREPPAIFGELLDLLAGEVIVERQRLR